MLLSHASLSENSTNRLLLILMPDSVEICYQKNILSDLSGLSFSVTVHVTRYWSYHQRDIDLGSIDVSAISTSAALIFDFF